eukprot:GEMP01064231.1.p1 GENE.GEMP01064231.1~~GEMP01064231.1.p1  ORF type:complete len:393 (+),score=102.77 GEMP01064231.1:88-1266(+)
MAGAMFGNQATAGSFGGMGFMAPSTQDGLAGVLNTSTQGAPLGENRTSKNSIIPLTFKMFLNAMQEQGNDVGPDQRRKIHGREVSNVTFVAQVMQVQEQSSFWIFSMDDSTACADVKYWIDNEDYATVERLKTTMQRGKYLRVVASIRVYKEETVITAHHLAPVDGVEVPAHLIEAVYVKKKLLMPKPEKKALPQQTNQQFQPQNFGGGNFGAQPQQQQQQQQQHQHQQHQPQQQQQPQQHQFPGQPMMHQNAPGQGGFQSTAQPFGQPPQAPQQFGGAPGQQGFGGAPGQQNFGGAPGQQFQNGQGSGQPQGRAHPYGGGGPRIRPEELVQIFHQYQGNSEHGLHRDQAFQLLQQKYANVPVEEFNSLLEICVNDEGALHETNEHHFKTAA